MTLVGQKTAQTLLLFALSASMADRGWAALYDCDLPNVEIHGDDPPSASMACDATRKAIDFLRQHGLDVSSDRIVIELVAQLADGVRDTVAGYLVRRNHKAVVLDYAGFRAFGRWLRVDIDPGIYRALVAHEVAHVVAAHNFQVSQPTIQAQEYIAYVTAFATMSPDQRGLVLARFDGDGFETEQQMNTTIYLCDPMRFGAEAYRHFVKKGKAEGYFRSILSGTALAH